MINNAASCGKMYNLLMFFLWSLVACNTDKKCLGFSLNKNEYNK